MAALYLEFALFNMAYAGQFLQISSNSNGAYVQGQLLSKDAATLAAAIQSGAFKIVVDGNTMTVADIPFSPTPGPSTSASTSTGMIIGVAVGIGAVVLVALLVLIYIRRRMRENSAVLSEENFVYNNTQLVDI